MQKIATGNHIPKEHNRFDYSVEKNIKNYSEETNKKPNEITVCILK